MKLYEYQAKEILSSAGIPVPRGHLVHSPQEVDEVAREFHLPAMLKAQVLAGKRGKAGLIRRKTDWTQIRDTVREWVGKGFGGETIQSVLLEKPLNIARELYVAVTIDPVSGSPFMMGCAEGGMEIEDLSTARPEAILSERIHVFRGLRSYQARAIVEHLAIKGDTAKGATRVLSTMYDLFRSHDAELVEINPLIVDTEGRLWAADAKLRIDDNALFRQKGFSKGRDQFEDDLEYEAYQNGLSYVKLDGNIGVLCTGAGLTMTLLDLIHMAGGRPANFLEFGGATYKNAATALRIALKNPTVKVLLIVTFGLVARADVIAEGIVKAIQDLNPTLPIITAVRGTGEEKARELIRGIGIDTCDDTEEAVRKAVQMAEA
jgi:succinyl-CoA synthetase beta subunit